MSKYEELRTVLSEELFLVEALRDLGYNPEVSNEGLSLYGYLGDERLEKAHIVMRRRQLDSASNDIGFARDANGVYRALISEYDRGIGFNDAWLGARCADLQGAPDDGGREVEGLPVSGAADG